MLSSMSKGSLHNRGCHAAMSMCLTKSEQLPSSAVVVLGGTDSCPLGIGKHNPHVLEPVREESMRRVSYEYKKSNAEHTNIVASFSKLLSLDNIFF